MSNTNKKRIIKSYEKLTDEFLAQIQAAYPLGFSQHIIYYTDRDGKLQPAVPYETEDTYYMIKVPVQAVVVEEEAEVELESNNEENSDSGNPESSHTMEELEELAYGGSGMIKTIDPAEEPDF